MQYWNESMRSTGGPLHRFSQNMRTSNAPTLIVCLNWKSLITTSFVVLIFNTTLAQDSVSVFKSNFLSPIVLVSAGLLTATDNKVFDKWEIREERQEHFPTFRSRVDDYLQYTPIAAAYALDAFQIRGVHKIGPKTVQLIKAELLVIAITYPMKRLIGTPRPDTGAPNSFPSGHAAQAFAAATFFHKEYGHISPWYSIGAYSVATTVGVMRVLNNRHWASDVLAGAGIGILATNLAYLTERKNRHARHAKVLKQITLSPTYARGALGFIFLARLDK